MGAAGLDLTEVLATPIDGGTVGFPADAATTVGEVGSRAWRRQDLPLPSVILRETALAHNLQRMAAYCASQGVDIAPHGKTTMAPQLWARQLAAGAWGMTAATPGQVRVMRRVGVREIMLANELVDPVSIAWLASALGEPDWGFTCWVDSPRGVALLREGLRAARAPRPVNVLVEMGHAGGRTGCRTVDAAVALARDVAAGDGLRLAGVAGYEGTIGHERSREVLAGVDHFLDEVRTVARMIIDAGLVDGREIIVSAGGSMFFDRVVGRLRDEWPGGVPVRVVLRSGCTITHDHGLYERSSPFAGAASTDRFVPAFEARGVVLSRPEPTVAVIGLGKRDVPSDIEPPIALRLPGRIEELRDRLIVTRLMDQHAICAVPATLEMGPGDEVVFGISHPCSAFDRRRVIAVLDDDDRVVAAVATLF